MPSVAMDVADTTSGACFNTILAKQPLLRTEPLRTCAARAFQSDDGQFAMTATEYNAGLIVEQESPSKLVARLSGDRRIGSEALSVESVREALDRAQGAKSLSFETAGLTGWDSRFVAFIRNCGELC